MTTRNINITQDQSNNSLSSYSYKPVVGEDFGDIQTDAPSFFEGPFTIRDHKRALEELAKLACPRNDLCGGTLHLETDPDLPETPTPFQLLLSPDTPAPESEYYSGMAFAVKACSLVCKRADCPPRPESGDREPLVPDPNQPSLFEQVPIPLV